MSSRKLTITKCDDSFNPSKQAGDVFEVMLNPESYARSWQVEFSTTKTIGQSDHSDKFAAMGPSTIDFRGVILDGTGVVDGGAKPVSERVEQLYKVVAEYDPKKRKPSYVQLLWGDLIFFGALESLSVDYTLFAADGTPLRAKVDMRFKHTKACKEILRAAGASPRNCSQIVDVVAGDTLSLLCYKVYGSCDYAKDVARINEIGSLLDLKPGMKVRFPPLA